MLKRNSNQLFSAKINSNLLFICVEKTRIGYFVIKNLPESVISHRKETENMAESVILLPKESVNPNKKLNR